MIPVQIVNDDGTYDLFVTVTDNKISPPSVVPGMNSRRINHGSAPIPVLVEADQNGHGDVSWHAVQADTDQPKVKDGNQQPSAGDDVPVNVFGV